MGFKFIDVFTKLTDDKIDGSQSECDKLLRKTGAQYMKEWLFHNRKEKIHQNIETENKENASREIISNEKEKKLTLLLRESLDRFEEEGNPFILADMISIVYAIAKERGISRENIDKNVKL